MIFETLKLHSGLLTYGQPPEWDWTRKGGSYSKKRDFFCVHWEVHHPENNPDFAHSVRLHVESPSHTTDSELNEIKRQVVEALQTRRLELPTENNGLYYKKGSRVSLESIRKNRCTEVFRVTFPANKRGGTPEQNIETVHAALGSEVQMILGSFLEALNRQFGN